MGRGRRAPAAVLLLAAAIDPVPGGSSVTAVGRTRRGHARDGGRGERGRRGDSDRRRRRAHPGQGRRGTRRRARRRHRDLAATAVISAADPRRTLLGLVDPIELDPAFLTRIRNYRCPARSRRSTSPCAALPAFRGLNGDRRRMLRGRVHVAPGIDYLERAFDASKYGEISPAPVPRHRVSVDPRSVDGPGRVAT